MALIGPWAQQLVHEEAASKLFFQPYGSAKPIQPHWSCGIDRALLASERKQATHCL